MSHSVIILPSRGKSGNSNRIGWKDYVARQYANAKKRKRIVAKVIAGEPIVRQNTCVNKKPEVISVTGLSF